MEGQIVDLQKNPWPLSHFAQGQLLPLNIFFVSYAPLWFLIQPYQISIKLPGRLKRKLLYPW